MDPDIQDAQEIQANIPVEIPVSLAYGNMPPARRFLMCTRHVQGPLDVWYDCSQCCPGSKEESLVHLKWMTQKEVAEWPHHTSEMLRIINQVFVDARSTRRNE